MSDWLCFMSRLPNGSLLGSSADRLPIREPFQSLDAVERPSGSWCHTPGGHDGSVEDLFDYFLEVGQRIGLLDETGQSFAGKFLSHVLFIVAT